jgi:hypothetical protein
MQCNVGERYLPVLKLTTISTRKMVSERQLKAIHLVERSSLKNEIATGKMMRLATNNRSMHRSQ